MDRGFALVLGGALLAGASAAAWLLERRLRSRARLWSSEDSEPREATAGALARWLGRAGVRGPGAVSRFAVACVLAAGAALAAPFLLAGSPGLASTAQAVASLPVVGLPVARAVVALPWLASPLLAALPWLIVRARRERRVEAIEQDLPLLLELLATLAEGGLGFDASLARILDTERPDRPLAQELRLYRSEQLGGASRVECLRRLARRIAIPSVASVVAALVQAEETGSGLAEVLRPLADDLSERRRERALARAEALPEKLVFPLVLGFLPSLLVWTLGPSFFQLFGVIDSIMRGAP
jgi:tight adherence protein C